MLHNPNSSNLSFISHLLYLRERILPVSLIASRAYSEKAVFNNYKRPLAYTKKFAKIWLTILTRTLIPDDIHT